MNQFDDSLSKIIFQVKNRLDELIQYNNGEYYVVDPIDGKAIEGHYGASHAAVGYAIFSQQFDNADAGEKSKHLVESIVNRWDIIKNERDFHADFNLFALCLYLKYGNKLIEDSLYDRIRDLIINTSDSKHYTVNWLPMRAYVNRCRYEWTHNKKYLDTINSINKLLQRSTYNDYLMDDRIPAGISYNVQYNIATVATLALIEKEWSFYYCDKMVSSLCRFILPDGDINYLGRGCNQLFAWGPWLYLLRTTGRNREFDLSLEYVNKRVKISLENNNLLLNSFPGEERNLWWDYHHFSVYISHMFMWLTLATCFCDANSGLGTKDKSIGNNGLDSGVIIEQTDTYGVIMFNGRKEYLAEKGPAIYAIWTQNHGVIYKGAFGPWFGAFGNKFSNPVECIINYFGLIKVKHDVSHANNRLLRKLNIIEQTKPYLEIKPCFIMPKISSKSNQLHIEYKDNSNCEFLCNIPSIADNRVFKLLVDGQVAELTNGISINNQYGCCKVFQSKVLKGNNWEIIISL